MNFVEQAPIALCILGGPQYIVEVVNEKMLELWGMESNEVLNKPLFEMIPTDLEKYGFKKILASIYASGKSFIAPEISINHPGNNSFDRIFLKFIYEALLDENKQVTGIMVMADDITEEVKYRKEIEESESRLKIALDSAQMGSFQWNVDESVFHYSEKLANIFGYKDTKGLDHKSFSALIHPDDEIIRVAAHENAFKTGKLFYEARFVWPDNSLHWIRMNGKVIFDDKNAPQSLYGTVLDITSQKLQEEYLEKKVQERTFSLLKSNEDLKQSEERYHSMIDEVEDYAILLLSPEGTILNWNKGAEKIKGYKEKEAVGKNFSMFYLPEDKATGLPNKLINEAATTGKATQEGWRMRKDGTPFYASVVITALHDAKGNITGFSKVTRDLTQRKKNEEKLKQYTEELEIQNDELNQFAYVASHDLQEPLRKIQMFTTLLEQNIDTPSQRQEYLSKIYSSAQRMSDLIVSLLNYSRLSNDGNEFVKTDLNEILREVKIDFEVLIQQKNVSIISDKLPLIKAIPLQMQQLFSNLISNSIKFCEKEPIISIGSRNLSSEEVEKNSMLDPLKTYVELKFSDNGIGFEQEYADQIFIIFQRLNEKHTYTGTGIGLALCKKIMEKHKGHIFAESTPGTGSIFYVYLPIS